nr:hypothetical protein [Candidatus Cloacimonadota bacterium]
MDYNKILDQFEVDKENLEKAVVFIQGINGEKELNYELIKSEFDFNKSQFYFALYKSLLESEYLSRDEPDNELLVKITKRDLFKQMKLPYEERREFLGFVILYLNHKLGCSFNDQVLEINATDNQFDYFQIQHEMSNVLPYMKIINEDVLSILEHFAIQAEQDMTVGEVHNSCLKFCSLNFNQGWELVDLMIKEEKTRFLINALHGLSVVDFSKTFNFSKTLYDSEYKSDIIIYYGYLNYNEIKNLLFVLDLLEPEFKNENKDVQVALSKCYPNIVYHPLIAENKLEERVFKKISVIASRKIPEVLYNILST